MGASEWINKAKDFATGHKDQVQGALDKAEGVVKSKTGDKYDDKIAKGRGALEDKLGFADGEKPDANAGGATAGEQAAGEATAEQPGGSGPDAGDSTAQDGGEPRAE